MFCPDSRSVCVCVAGRRTRWRGLGVIPPPLEKPSFMLIFCFLGYIFTIKVVRNVLVSELFSPIFKESRFLRRPQTWSGFEQIFDDPMFVDESDSAGL